LELQVQPYILTSCNSGSDTEKTESLSLVDFLRGLLEVDPNRRWSPLQVFSDDIGAFICGFSFLL
jgi:dual specificity protein kinase YAK1